MVKYLVWYFHTHINTSPTFTQCNYLVLFLFVYNVSAIIFILFIYNFQCTTTTTHHVYYNNVWFQFSIPQSLV